MSSPKTGATHYHVLPDKGRTIKELALLSSLNTNTYLFSIVKTMRLLYIAEMKTHHFLVLRLTEQKRENNNMIIPSGRQERGTRQGGDNGL